MFRTELNITPSQNKIDLKSKLLFMGSCFSDNIGKKFVENKFDVLSNPFGVIYNPLSVLELIDIAQKGKALPQHLFVQNQEIWYHYLLHSDLSNTKKARLEADIDKKLTETKEQLNNIDFLIVTLGTANVFQLAKSGETVANCHKIPRYTFERRMLDIEEIVNGFEEMLALLSPNTKVILTVSPVRHVRDSLQTNAISKSILRLTAHQLQTRNEQVDYFPAYELLLDDLRDYRFYASDMVHPSEEAIEYISQKFHETYLSDSATAFIKKWGKLNKALHHRPFHTDTNAYADFLEKTLEKLNTITEVNVEKEIEEVKNKIENL
ncbi:GSCFA domain-containing protein [Flammeovirgaceae bacterium SG7u.111]|nr:GSCFA domain-containing protein [Flammeovirgaceae bacterium SG7u.132]WPO38206.1 GSCFA domain-containing protein [Flammeovirgaceae bacterium SG7u.111]